ncbi:MAG: hypothetical protein U9R00_00515 [Patescibacteria group bacterium]|nr:hypothetical protein [Patescibacteria group bacterium]
MKKITFIVIILAAILAVIFIFTRKEENDLVSLCYYSTKPTESGLNDKAWVKLDINNDEKEKITGEFYHIPAESNSKVGQFEGKVNKLTSETTSRKATVWWNAFAEGTYTMEELIIDFGEGSAVSLFGEKADRGDGVFVYKNKNNLSASQSMGKIDCNDLEEIQTVEKYMIENIGKVVKDEPVLGGSWYLVDILIAPAQNTGTMIFEDGHIRKEGNFKYTYEEGIVKNISTTNTIEL